MNRKAGAKITAVDGQAIDKDTDVEVGFARVALTDKGTLNITPGKGWQMENIWLPSPDRVWSRLLSVATDGYQNVTLAEHLVILAISRCGWLYAWAQLWAFRWAMPWA